MPMSRFKARLVILLLTSIAFTYSLRGVGPRKNAFSLKSTKAMGYEDKNLAQNTQSSTWDKDAWLLGWETCKEETAITLDTKENKIPLDIDGTYFRNGHAKFEVGKDQVIHPFDADGMITALTIKDGVVTFRNRFIRTKGFVREQKARRILYRGAFGTQRRGGFLSNLFDVKIKNVANTNVLFWANRLLALWEGGLPHRIEPDSLRTFGEYKIKDLLKPGDTFSAHPRLDSKTGRLINFSSSQKVSGSDLSIFEFDKDFNVLKQRMVTIPGFVFFHDFVVTENYYIFNKAPIQFNPLPFLLGKLGPAECIQFDPSSPAILYLIPRDGSSPVEEIKLDSHFNFHFANAYEQNGEVIFDVVWCNNMELGKNEEKKEPIWTKIDYGKQVPYSTLVRYTLTPPSSPSRSSSPSTSSPSWTYSKKSLSSTQLDFPTINLDKSCIPHRYTYAACGSDPSQSSPVQGVVKIDSVQGTEQKWMPLKHEYLGESIFVNKKDGSKAEDDGYLMSFLMNGKENTSEFVIFDAQNVSKGPIVRVPLPTKIPFGLHGSFAQGLIFDPEDIIRKHKACKAVDNKGWNSVDGGFSGLGLKFLL